MSRTLSRLKAGKTSPHIQTRLTLRSWYSLRAVVSAEGSFIDLRVRKSCWRRWHPGHSQLLVDGSLKCRKTDRHLSLLCDGWWFHISFQPEVTFSLEKVFSLILIFFSRANPGRVCSYNDNVATEYTEKITWLDYT